MSAAQVIQVLEIILLVVAILVGGKIYFLLADVRRAVVGIETTRNEITSTLKRVETVAETTDRVLREELAPTLQSARETLDTVHTATRSLAESAQIVRKAAGAVEDAQKFFSSSGPIAQAIVKKASSVAGGFLSGIASGLKSVMGRGEPAPAKKRQIEPAPEEHVASPATADTNEVLHAADVKPVAAKSDRKKR